MTVKEVPTRYEASDGEMFDTKEEAEHHDKIVTAKKKFDAAVAAFNRTLGESFTTADGKPFQFGETYYVVYDRHDGEGFTREHFWPNDCTFETDHEPHVIRSRYLNGKRETDRFALTSIFDGKKKAMQKVLELRRKRLGWLKESIATLTKEIEAER